MQRAIGVIVGLLVLFWIVTAPVSAAGTVTAVLGGLASAGNSLVVFLQNLV